MDAATHSIRLPLAAKQAGCVLLPKHTLGPVTTTLGPLQLLQVVRVTAVAGVEKETGAMASTRTLWVPDSTKASPGLMVDSLGSFTERVVSCAVHKLALPSSPQVVVSNSSRQGNMASAARVLRPMVMVRPSSCSLAFRMVRTLAVHRPKQGVVEMPAAAVHPSFWQRVLALHSKPAGRAGSERRWRVCGRHK